jgi:DNA-binding protein HU-beta
VTNAAADHATKDLIDALVKEMKKTGRFTLPSLGTFIVRKTKARKALNPRTGAPIRVKAGKTVRFKASPALKRPCNAPNLSSASSPSGYRRAHPIRFAFGYSCYKPIGLVRMQSNQGSPGDTVQPARTGCAPDDKSVPRLLGE